MASQNGNPGGGTAEKPGEDLRPVTIDPERLSEMELTLTVLWNAVRRWINQRSKMSDVGGLADLDVFILHLIVYRNRPLRVSDLGFALAIDDLHQVTYAVKKLVRLELLDSSKQGKEVYYAATERSRRHYDEFIRDRHRYLEPSMALVLQGDNTLETLTSLLRTVSGVYEQAARSAASAPGLPTGRTQKEITASTPSGRRTASSSKRG